MNEIILNKLDKIKTMYGKNTSLLAKCNVYVARNGCALGDYFAATIAQYLNPNRYVVYADAQSGRDALCLEDVQGKLVMAADMNGIPRNTKAVFTINCMDERFQNSEEQQKVLEHLDACCARFAQNKTLLLFAAVVPQPDACPGEMTSLAEREYDAYLEQKKEHTWQEKFYLKMERILRDYALNKQKRLIQLRFTNVIGPECNKMVQIMDLDALFAQIQETGRVTIGAEDTVDHFSYTPLCNAVHAMLLAYANPRRLIGRTYSVSCGRASVQEFKYALYKGFADQLTLDTRPLAPVQPVYHALNSLRFCAAFPAFTHHSMELEELLYRMGCYHFDQAYNIFRKLGVYEGRLEMIKAAEMELLKIVDDICRRHQIQYFLAGGSTLGAVRHNNVIPWDDDIDIGMLREDYEKFRRIVPEELPEPLLYENANSKHNSHYHFDKIRVPDTFFSTKYSGNFKIPDGIFLDILVYDKTSNRKFCQKLHIKLTVLWTRVINIKWINRPRKNIHYLASKIALPFMRLVPWSFFHGMFERIARLYEHRKKACYAIDTCGLNIKKGVLQLKWMQEVIYVPFGDMMAPIPAQYDAYLKHFYGPNYMSLLPIDKRVSGHNMARLDLGPVIYGDEAQKKFDRMLSIRGDLMESDGRQGLPLDGNGSEDKVYNQAHLKALQKKAEKEALLESQKAAVEKKRAKMERNKARNTISVKKATRKKKNQKLNSGKGGKK